MKRLRGERSSEDGLTLTIIQTEECTEKNPISQSSGVSMPGTDSEDSSPLSRKPVTECAVLCARSSCGAAAAASGRESPGADS